MWKLAGIVTAIALTAAGAYAFVNWDEKMKMVEIQLVVDASLRKSGGVVIVLPIKLPRADFEAKYADDLRRLDKGADGRQGKPLLFSGQVAGDVDFVRFDTPDDDYSYRFVADEASGGERSVVRETQIGVGGSGYTDAKTDLPVETTSVMTHYIQGDRISVHVARGLETLSSKFVIDESACHVFDRVTVCTASKEDVDKGLVTIKALDGGG